MTTEKKMFEFFNVLVCFNLIFVTEILEIIFVFASICLNITFVSYSTYHLHKFWRKKAKAKLKKILFKVSNFLIEENFNLVLP